MSYDDFKRAVLAGASNPVTKPLPPEQPSPVRGFFDRLVHGEDGRGFTLSRAGDVVRSAARGGLNMVNETISTLGEGEAYAIRKTGLGDDSFNTEYDQKGARHFTQDRIAAANLHIPTDKLLGNRSDDLLAGFTEDATQFLSSFALGDAAAAGKLGELGGAVGLASRALRGAAAEFTAFDPRSGSLAGLIAKIPVPGVQQLGQALLEKPEDSELAARLKRSAAGAIPGIVIDGLVEGIRGAAALLEAQGGLPSGETLTKATAARAAVTEAKEGVKKAAAKVGPNTYTVADEADVLDMAKKASAERETPDLEKLGLNDGTRDTEGVTASDFQLSRERQAAVNALRRAQQALQDLGETPAFDPEVLADNRSLRGERVKNQADLQRSEPLEKPDVEAQKGPQNPIENLSKLLDQAESQLNQALERVEKSRAPKQQGRALPEDVSPVSTYIKQGPTTKPMVGGMATRPVQFSHPEEVKTILRVAKLANGDVNALYGVGKTARVIQEGGLLKSAMEVGINSMLSGIPTAATVHIMGTATTMYNVITKGLAGAFTGNTALMREALDQFIANERFAVDNLKVARMAAVEGRSIINPNDAHEVIPGMLVDVVRLPPKVLTASEEFTRVTNYRSEVYAKSLRYWREQGLQGDSLAAQVAKDLDSAFTPEGVARLPGPLSRADAATFRQPLQPGSFGADLNNFMNARFATKIIAPFVRTSINMARWQFERTPLLNMFLERSRPILLGKEGQEAAAQLWTQTAVSGWLGYYA